MIQQFIAIFFGDFVLQALNFLADELDDVTGLDADHVVVMVAIVKFEHRVSALEVVTRDESGRLKLGQDAIDRRQPDILA